LVLVFEDVAQRGRLECGRVVIEPPAHVGIGAEPKIDARVIVGVERHAVERIAVAMDHADRAHVDVFVEDVAVERREQRRGSGAVEAGVVKKHFEDARHERRDHTAVATPLDVGAGVTTLAMNIKLYAWLVSGHLIGVFVWMGGLFAVYWLLRIHSHSPTEMHEKLTLMERSMALMMDVAAALAIGCGVTMLIVHKPNLLTNKGGWLHIKLTVVVLGILPVHGMIRARIKKFGQGKISPVPNWQWTVLLASVTAISILVFVVRQAMMTP
jgi:uncharacterized membrane protein